LRLGSTEIIEYKYQRSQMSNCNTNCGKSQL